MTHPLLSLAMIVKNEEQTLPRALRSVTGLVDEIVVVDTGSSDQTVQLAKDLGAKVYFFPWIDDFSAARNYSLSLCHGQWILIIDADEVIAQADHQALRTLLENSQIDAVELVQANYWGQHNSVLWQPISQHTPENEGFDGFLKSPVVRLIRNGQDYVFRDRIHETLIGSLREQDAKIYHSAILIHHYGTPVGSASKRGQAKAQMYNRLIQEQATRYPEDAKAQWQLSEVLRGQGQQDAALQALRRAYELDPTFELAVVGIAQQLLNSQLPADAEKLLFDFATRNGDLSFAATELLATTRLFQGKLVEAAALFAQIIKSDKRRPIASLWAAILAEEQDDLALAESLYAQLLAHHPHFEAGQARANSFALRRKAENFAQQNNLHEALSTLRQALQADPQDHLVFCALARLSRQAGLDVDSQDYLARAITLAPFSRQAHDLQRLI